MTSTDTNTDARAGGAEERKHEPNAIQRRNWIRHYGARDPLTACTMSAQTLEAERDEARDAQAHEARLLDAREDRDDAEKERDALRADLERVTLEKCEAVVDLAHGKAEAEKFYNDLRERHDRAVEWQKAAETARDRDRSAICEIGRLQWGDRKDCYSEQAVLRMVKEEFEKRDAALARALAAEAKQAIDERQCSAMTDLAGKARAEADALRSALDRIEHEIGSIPRIHDETAEEFRSVALFASEIAQVVLFVARNALAASAPEARVVVLDEQEARNVRVLIHNAPPLGVAQWCGPILARINAAWPPVMGIDLRRPGPSTYSTVMTPEARVWLTEIEARSVLQEHDDDGRYVLDDPGVFDRLRGRLAALTKPVVWDIPCPSSECPACTGKACRLCGAGCWNSTARDCEHDVLERHEIGTKPATPESDAGGKGAASPRSCAPAAT